MLLKKIELIQNSLKLLQPQTTQVAALFYRRLFELDASLRPLFPADMKQQESKFILTLSAVVANLDQPESMITAVKQLGLRHSGYGVQDAHYHTVGEALLWTLSQVLGNHFTPEVEEAWVEAYYLLAGLMQEATYTRAEFV